MHYEFYIDVYVFTNFFFDYLTLLLLREVRNKECGIKRMVLAAMLGVLAATVLMLVLKNGIVYRLLIHLLVNPLMFYGCFLQKNFREFILDYTAGYLLMMLTGGCVQWLCQIVGKTHLFGIVMAVAAVLLSVFLILYKKEREEDKIYNIKICQGGCELSTKGFLDTGNLLTDPYIKRPVSLISKDTLMQIEGVKELPCRYIPFISLGEEHGLIQAVTVEELCIQRKKQEIRIKPAVFAMVEEEFIKSSEYQVILNGRLW